MGSCPSCGLPILEGVTTCPACGAALGTTAGGVVLPPPPSAAAPDADGRALRFSHSGERYLLGYGRDFFGIWDRGRPDVPIRRFPRTDEGWTEAWRAYAAMEPNAVAVEIAPETVPPPSSWAATPPRRAVSGLWWLLPILLGWVGGLIAYLVNREADPATARAMLLVGIVLSVVGVLLLAALPTVAP